MFERFTDRARQVVSLAQDEAARHRHDHIGTEHMLLGLLREGDGVAASVLKSLDITVERVRARVVPFVGSGEAAGQLPLTLPAKKVFELALREALSLGHNYIGTEHILLALVRENEGVAVRILLDFDADSEKIRNEVIRMLSGSGGCRQSAGVGAGEACRSSADAHGAEATLPDMDKLSDRALKDLIGRLTDRERAVSCERRILHGKIDILRAELVNRLRRDHERSSWRL